MFYLHSCVFDLQGWISTHSRGFTFSVGEPWIFYAWNSVGLFHLSRISCYFTTAIYGLEGKLTTVNQARCCERNINLNFLTTPPCHPLFIDRLEKLSLSRHTIFLHLDHIVHCTSSIGFIAIMLNHSWTWLPLLLVLFKLSFTAIFSTSTLQKVTSCWHISSFRSNVLITLFYLQFLKERSYSCPLEVNEYVAVG